MGMHTCWLRLLLSDRVPPGALASAGSPPSLERPLVLAGMGDMAVSNSIGSNVFDILIGLGLPWALQTLAVDYGSYVSGFSPWLLFTSGATRTFFDGLGHCDFVSRQRGVEILMLRDKQVLPIKVLAHSGLQGHSGLKGRVGKLFL